MNPSEMTTAIIMVIAGMVIVGLGQVFQALREVALNTREAVKDNPGFQRRGGAYHGLSVIATIYVVLGTLLVVGALIYALSREGGSQNDAGNPFMYDLHK